jgi:peptidoglycan hydrolase CwlO-like protein
VRRTMIELIIVITFLAPLIVGCSSAPPCTVSPIEIEETREDHKNLDKSLQEANGKAQDLQRQLTEKQKEHDSKKDEPAVLQKKLEELKKGSGRG